MRSVEKSARSVDEAVALALEELRVPSHRVKVEVLEEAKGGFLGLIGGKQAVVRVTVRETRAEKAEEWFRDVCRAMGVDVEVVVREQGDHIHVDITGQEAGMLIGHHGQTLEALQYLGNLTIARIDDESRRLLLDVEGYRKRREETLTRLASRLADRVKRTGESVALEPMSAHERRVIHMALQDDPTVVTGSEGDDPFRRVVIHPKR